jgi:hypothetical protein
MQAASTTMAQTAVDAARKLLGRIGFDLHDPAKRQC